MQVQVWHNYEGQVTFSFNQPTNQSIKLYITRVIRSSEKKNTYELVVLKFVMYVFLSFQDH